MNESSLAESTRSGLFSKARNEIADLVSQSPETLEGADALMLQVTRVASTYRYVTGGEVDVVTPKRSESREQTIQNLICIFQEVESNRHSEATKADIARAKARRIENSNGGERK